MINLSSIQSHVLNDLTNKLATTLTYHNAAHTLDVFEQCIAIADEEGITDKRVLLNLSLAALYHDTGFLYIYQGHEEKSCEIARSELPHFGVDEDQLDEICELIMATKVPQTPLTHVQKIICDADLDYLGRNDFYETGSKLHRELIAFNIVGDEHDWEERQLKFLKEHHFFTASSDRKRTIKKLAHIERLEQLQFAKR